MAQLLFLVILVLISAVVSKPVEITEDMAELNVVPVAVHTVQKRFINPSLTSGDFDAAGRFSKMRTKRSEEDCEKLRLCKLHARSNRNFFAAFELYFVNRENAHLWDHHARSLAQCDQRFSCDEYER